MNNCENRKWLEFTKLWILWSFFFSFTMPVPISIASSIIHIHSNNCDTNNCFLNGAPLLQVLLFNHPVIKDVYRLEIEYLIYIYVIFFVTRYYEKIKCGNGRYFVILRCNLATFFTKMFRRQVLVFSSTLCILTFLKYVVLPLFVISPFRRNIKYVTVLSYRSHVSRSMLIQCLVLIRISFVINCYFVL